MNNIPSISIVNLDTTDITPKGDKKNKRVNWIRLISDTVIAEFLQGKTIRLDYTADAWNCRCNFERILQEYLPANTKIKAVHQHVRSTSVGTWYFCLVSMDTTLPKENKKEPILSIVESVTFTDDMKIKKEGKWVKHVTGEPILMRVAQGEEIE